MGGNSTTQARTGVLVIDLRTGDTRHWVRLSGVVTELYDVVALSGVGRPMALGFRNDEVQRMITVGSWATVGDGETQSVINDQSDIDNPISRQLCLNAHRNASLANTRLSRGAPGSVWPWG